MTGPRYSIIPADAYSDDRMKDLHIRVLGILGTHTNNNGWCEVNQRVIAEKCGRSRETINRTIRDLCEFGYLSKREQRTKANGRTINLYQVLMDRPARAQDAAPLVTPASQGAVTPEDHNGCDVATSQLNDPSSNEDPPSPPQAGDQGFAELRKAWPQDHWGNLDNAGGAFAKLSGEDKSSAVRNAPAAALAFTRRKGRVPALAAYIRSRVFRDFDGGPEIDAEGDWRITPSRPEWGPWLGWVRSKHGQRGVDSVVKRGFFLVPTRWPEGHLDQARAGALH
jgi:hypothetical protein